MNAPGRFYVYRWDTGDLSVFEIKPKTFRLSDNSSHFYTRERLISPTHHDQPWSDNAGMASHVVGWYDTLEEAIFAMEVLL